MPAELNGNFIVFFPRGFNKITVSSDSSLVQLTMIWRLVVTMLKYKVKIQNEKAKTRFKVSFTFVSRGHGQLL